MDTFARKPTLLVVEDSPTQLELIRMILEGTAEQVLTATNGREALAILEKATVDLVITDVMMPEMDGYELCKAIRSNERTRLLPVMLVTSLSDPKDIIRGLACGASNFIVKPYDERLLLSRVEYLLLNKELQQEVGVQMGIEVFFSGKRHFITSDRQQILNLLLSTYDVAVHKNQELHEAQDALRALNDSLEQKVIERTESLNREMLSRQMAEEEARRLNIILEQRVAERTAQLEAANTELELFNSSVSHDLRAPIRHMTAYCEILLKDHAEGLDSQGSRYLQRVVAAAHRMDQLTVDLLAFSRILYHEVQRRMVDLSALSREIANTLKTNEPRNDVTFIIPEELRVEGDERLLQVALQNLLSNAYKFTKNTPNAMIEIGVDAAHKERPTYFVRDNGIGFDMAYAEKLFKPFQRLRSNDEYPGTGVGLATVQRIIQRHGGHVRAEAAEGRGATFFFDLWRDRPVERRN